MSPFLNIWKLGTTRENFLQITYLVYLWVRNLFQVSLTPCCFCHWCCMFFLLLFLCSDLGTVVTLATRGGVWALIVLYSIYDIRPKLYQVIMTMANLFRENIFMSFKFIYFNIHDAITGSSLWGVGVRPAFLAIIFFIIHETTLRSLALTIIIVQNP